MTARARWFGWGTQVEVALTERRWVEAARSLVRLRLGALDRACGRFRSDSELASIDTAAGRQVRVGPELAAALEVALDAARDSDGVLDPTVAVATAEGFAEAATLRVAAAAGAGTVAVRVLHRPAASWRSVEFDAARRLLRVPAGVRLDLGATLPAWAADDCARQLAAEFGGGALVRIGGDVATAGRAPAGEWQVRVATAGGVTRGLNLPSGGLVTRAPGRRRGELAADVLLGAGRDAVPGGSAAWRQVSVAAPDCLTAAIAAEVALATGAVAHWPARLVAGDGRSLPVQGWPAAAG